MGILDKLFGPPRKDKYAEIFIAALRSAGDRRQVRYDAQEFRLVHGDDGGYTNLSNLYSEFCAAPKEDRDRCLKMQVRGVLSHLKEMPDEFEFAKCDLRPKIWARATLEKTRLQQRVEGAQQLNLPTQLVGTHLEASLAFDFPEAVRTISADDLERWDVNYYEAMEVARHNLITSEFAFASIGESLYTSVTGDTYDASRLMCLELIENLSVQGDRIAMAPNRDTLLVTGSEDEDGLAMMLAFAEKAMGDPRPMVPVPLRLDGDEWVDWTPPADHPLRSQFDKLELMFLHPEYEAQKALLDELHEIEVDGDFVASYTAVEKKETGQLVSYCTWGNGVSALLPKAQKIVFIRGESDIPALAPWDRVVEVAGELMEETDLYPPRYRVTKFPSNWQLAKIGREDL